jgi:streptomycin 6-kinase
VIYSRKNTYKLYQLEKYAALTEAEAVFVTTTEAEAVYLRSADAEAEAVVAMMTTDVEAAVRGGVALRWWEGGCALCTLLQLSKS